MQDQSKCWDPRILRYDLRIIRRRSRMRGCKSAQCAAYIKDRQHLLRPPYPLIHRLPVTERFTDPLEYDVEGQQQRCTRLRS